MPLQAENGRPRGAVHTRCARRLGSHPHVLRQQLQMLDQLQRRLVAMPGSLASIFRKHVRDFLGQFGPKLLNVRRLVALVLQELLQHRPLRETAAARPA